MTGPEHYRHAEGHLDRAYDAPADEDGLMTHQVRYHLAVAQVHATLALAAATAVNPSMTTDGSLDCPADWKAWADVAAEPLAKNVGELA